MAASWSLIVTAPNVEFGVAQKLARLGIEFLLVKRRLVRICNGQRVVRLATAFPRYIFVCVHDAWQKVAQVTGVVDFVRIGSMPAMISDEVIGSLRSRIDSDGILPVVEKSRFSFGQKVMISGQGVHAGHDGIFQYALPNGRACVLQQWFDALRPVEVNEADLMAMSDYRAARNRSRQIRRKRKRQGRRFTERPLQKVA